MANASVSTEETTTTPATEAPENPAAEGSQGLLTQEQVNTLVGNARTKERAKYPNYDEYKAAFEELKELKDSQKSDLEKATSRADELQKELDALKAEKERKSWREEVSKETGVPADVIAGDTKEEMAAHAESLKKLIPDSTKPIVASDGFAPAAGGAGKSTREQFAEAMQNIF